MSARQSDVYEAFRDMGADEDKALKAAAALDKHDDDGGALETDLAMVTWMIGFMLAMRVVVFKSSLF